MQQMNRSARFLFSLATLCLVATTHALAQTGTYGAIVKGRVVDAQTGEPLEGVELTNEATLNTNGTMRTMSTTDSLGRFRVYGRGSSNRLRAELPGYYPAQKRFAVWSDNDTLDIGTLQMRPAEVLLESAVVSARIKKFHIKGDTVVFNPKAFQLPDGARLNDLIARLPGVSEKDGQLYWNDKPVRIQMNGQEGFANNDLLTNRLPAEAVDKLKVYNKASDDARHTGKQDGEEDYVLDVNVNPSWLEKWYGTLEASYRTTDKGEASADAMLLSAKNPLMVYADVNNLGATTMAKTMNQATYNRGGEAKQQYVAMGYKHNGVRQGQKPLEQESAINLQLGHSDRITRTTSSTERYRNALPSAFSLAQSRFYNHLFNPSLIYNGKYNLSATTLLRANGSLAYERSRQHTTTLQGQFEANPYDISADPIAEAFSPQGGSVVPLLTSRTRHDNRQQGRTFTAKADLTLTHWMKDKSSFSLKADFSYRHDADRYRLFEAIDYFALAPSPIAFLQDQLQTEPARNLRLGLTAIYKRWLLKNLQLTLTNAATYQSATENSRLYNLEQLAQYNNLDLNHWEQLSETEVGAALNTADSYRSHNHIRTDKTTLALLLRLKNLEIKPTFSYMHHNVHGRYRRAALDTLVHRANNLLGATLGINYKLGISMGLNATYKYTSSAATWLQTIDYTDSSDPANLRMGNPLLRNSHTHTATTTYYITNAEKEQNLSLQLSYTLAQAPVQTLFVYQPSTGTFLQRPYNVRSNYTLGGAFSFDRQLGDYFNLRTPLSVSYARRYAYLTLSTDASPAVHPLSDFSRTTQRNYTLTFKPELVFERKNLEAGLSASIALTASRNSQTSALYSDRNFLDYAPRIYGRYKWRTFEFYSSLTLDGHAGYATDTMNSLRPNWLARASWKTMNNHLKLSLEANDILHKSRYYYTTSGADYHTDTHYIQPNHYFQFTLEYTFDAKGKK